MHTHTQYTCTQAEEAHFRAQLQELEQQRMGVIEAAWRAREAQRQAEIAAMKAKYATLEKQTRDLLTATQERERSLLAAESELRLRKAELERQAAARMTEGEAAIRRLQVRQDVQVPAYMGTRPGRMHISHSLLCCAPSLVRSLQMQLRNKFACLMHMAETPLPSQAQNESK